MYTVRHHHLAEGGIPLCVLLLPLLLLPLLLLDHVRVSTSAVVVARSLSERPPQPPELSGVSDTGGALRKLAAGSTDDVIYDGYDGSSGVGVLDRHRRQTTTISGIVGMPPDVGECILLFGALYSGEQHVLHMMCVLIIPQ